MGRDTRPPVYKYWNQLTEHVSPDVIFKEVTYPRQFEIHLPGNHLRPCDLHCPHCAGRYFQKDLGTWEMDGLELLRKLEGKIPFHIYGGAYTEPLLNPYFMTFLHMTKRFNNHFGIHTNGVLLSKLEDTQGWLTELNRISTDDVDYLSVSIDAGLPESWCKTKGAKDSLFGEIIKGLRKIKDRKHSLRLCYLISPYSDSLENFDEIINIAIDLEVDSLRFSIPFAPYNQDFSEVRKYKRDRESYSDIYEEMLSPYFGGEKPYIFYTGPEFTDIDRFTFSKCAYPYYQITYGADGYAYKCSTTATPTMKMCRLGKITSDLDEFHLLLKRNANPDWDADTCFRNGARCNRMGLEINTEYERIANRNRILGKEVTALH